MIPSNSSVFMIAIILSTCSTLATHEVPDSTNNDVSKNETASTSYPTPWVSCLGGGTLATVQNSQMRLSASEIGSFYPKVQKALSPEAVKFRQRVREDRDYFYNPPKGFYEELNPGRAHHLMAPAEIKPVSAMKIHTSGQEKGASLPAPRTAETDASNPSYAQGQMLPNRRMQADIRRGDTKDVPVPDPDNFNEPITRGDEARPGYYPWAAHLSITSMIKLNSGDTPYYSFCGATVIADEWLLTAAHCADSAYITAQAQASVGDPAVELDIYAIEVKLGSTDLDDSGNIYQTFASEALCHADFDPQTFENDIALLRLTAPLDLAGQPNIVKATLPTTASDPVVPGGRVATVGWGLTDFYTSMQSQIQSPKLIEVSLSVDNDTVVPYDKRFSSNPSLQDGSGCRGDSGGPATSIFNTSGHTGNIVVGINSSITETSTGNTFQDGCAESGVTTWFTRVSHYKNDIESVLTLQ